jgi:hypothetical protein
MGEQGAAGTVFGPFEQMWSRILDYLPSLTAGFLVLLLGVAVGWLVKRLAVRVVLILRLDRTLRSFRWAKGLAQADVRYALANALGSFAAAIVVLVFLENAFVVWRLEVLSKLIGELVFYLPRLIVGAITLLVGSLIAAVVSNRVRTGLALEGIGRAGLVGRVTLWALMTIVGAFTLEEMGVAPRILNAAFTIGLGSIGLILALAIGLGSREAVAQFWRSVLDKPEKE